MNRSPRILAVNHSLDASTRRRAGVTSFRLYSQMLCWISFLPNPFSCLLLFSEYSCVNLPRFPSCKSRALQRTKYKKAYQPHRTLRDIVPNNVSAARCRILPTTRTRWIYRTPSMSGPLGVPRQRQRNEHGTTKPNDNGICITIC